MNRALRRQQLKEPKAKAGRAAGRVLPTGGRAAPRREAPGGLRLPRFVTDVVSELRKVVWPTREDTVHLTVVVVVVTVILGAVLGAIDIGFGRLIDELLLQ